MSKSTIDEIIPEIIHAACQAEVSADEQLKRQALADIYDAIASVLPVDNRKAGDEGIAETDALAKIEARLRVFNKSNLYPEQVKWLDETRQIALAAIGRAASMTPPPEELQGFAKFLTVAEGVQLVRFHGKDEIRLVARRVGSSGNPNTIFEIVIDKALKHATAFRDGRILFELQGVTVGYSKVEAMAVSSLKRWFKNQRGLNSRRRRALKRRRLGILTPEQELARTVAEQKEVK